MAVKTWVGVATKKWSQSESWSPNGTPTAAVDAAFVAENNNTCEENSATAKCRSLTFDTGYTAAWTSTASAVLAVGTSSASEREAGVALRIRSGTKWEPNNAFSITFVSTAGTVELIYANGRKLGNQVTFNGAGGKWKLEEALGESTSTGTIELVAGELNTNGQTVKADNLAISGTNTRALTLGASLVECNTWKAATTTNLTFSGASSSISWLTTFDGGGLTYGTVTLRQKRETATLKGSNTIASLVANTKGAAAKEGLQLEAGATQTITALATDGTAGSKARIESTSAGTQAKLKSDGQVIILRNTVIKDVVAEGTTQFWAGEGCTLENSTGWKEGEPAKPAIHGGGTLQVTAYRQTGQALEAHGGGRLQVAAEKQHGSAVQDSGGGRLQLSGQAEPGGTPRLTGGGLLQVVGIAEPGSSPALHGGGSLLVASERQHGSAIRISGAAHLAIEGGVFSEGKIIVHGGGDLQVVAYNLPSSAISIHGGGRAQARAAYYPSARIASSAGGKLELQGYYLPSSTLGLHGGGLLRLSGERQRGVALLLLHAGGRLQVAGERERGIALLAIHGGGSMSLAGHQANLPVSITIQDRLAADIRILHGEAARIDILEFV